MTLIELPFQTLAGQAVHLQTSEHVLLESEVRHSPEWGHARITHAAFQCRSRLRMRRLELAIIDYYYLAVRMTRMGSAHEYVLDLRFTDRSMQPARHIPWRWMLITVLLASSAAITIRQILPPTAHWWQEHGFPLCAITLGLTACAGFACAWRMTETLSLRSLHGGATLLEFTGGLGTLRSSRKFVRKLAAHIHFAVADRRPTLAAHLRDEMREHFRLKEAGVLSREQYELSKERILALHSKAPSAARRPHPVA